MTTIGSVVAIGIVAIGALGYASWAGNAWRANRHMELNGDREAIKHYLLASSDCDLSLGAGCTPGAVVPLFMTKTDGTRETIVAGDGAGTKVGSWTLRAECTAGGDGIIARATRLGVAGSLTSTAPPAFARDPMTGRTTMWSDPQSLLFPAGVEVCSLGRTPPHLEVSPAPVTPPVSPATCQGSYIGGWCSGPYSVHVDFKSRFAAPPAVIVSLAEPDTTGVTCPHTFSRFIARATNISTTGFTLTCAATPVDNAAPGGCAATTYWGYFLGSACTYLAVGR